MRAKAAARRSARHDRKNAARATAADAAAIPASEFKSLSTSPGMRSKRSLCVSVLNQNVFALHIAQFAEPLPKSFETYFSGAARRKILSEGRSPTAAPGKPERG